ncbi:MAG: hypothetical protein ACLRVQ_04245 [Lachnospiraceae bacterium]
MADKITIRKCKIVKTEYCTGLFLYVPKKEGAYKNAYIQSGLTFDEALDIIKIEMGDSYDENTFRLNHMYRVKDNRIFTLLYDKYHAGFVATEELADFIEKNNINIRYTYMISCDYMWAMAKVTALGALTGTDEIFLTREPKAGCWYRRIL